MAYIVKPINSFAKGLNLRDNPQQVAQDEAIDLLNVVFTERGAVAQRYGYAQFTSSALTNQVDSLGVFYTSTGTKQLIAGCGSRLEGINTSGAVVASATGLSGGPYTFARFAAPGSELLYAGNGTDTLRKWDGLAWTAPTATVDGTAARAMPKAGAIAIQPNDNRLAASGFATITGGPHGVASNPSRVFFSNAGAPETWETDGVAPRGANYLDLTPGDGEQIMGMVAWRNNLFVFKESKFFVFYGNSLATAGTPIFNYRAVDAGIGLCSRRALVAGYDGVYFMDRTGVYRTTGNEPELVSSIIDPFFQGSPSVYYRSNVLNHASLTKAAATFHENRLYIAVCTGSSVTNDSILVYDPRFKWWSLWNITAAALASFRASNQAELMFGYPTGAKKVYRYSSTYTNDDSAAISSRWRMGWPDFGIPQAKTTREVKLWGIGTCSVGLTSDFTTTTGSTQAVLFSGSVDLWGDGIISDTWGDGTGTDLWGPGNQPTLKLARQAIRGTNFSVEFANSTLDISWAISRMAFHVREKRMPTILNTDR